MLIHFDYDELARVSTVRDYLTGSGSSSTWKSFDVNYTQERQKVAGSENASFKLLRSGEDMECGTSVPLSNAAKPPSRGNGSLNDQVYRLAKAEGKGGSAADQGDTGVPHSKDLATKDRRIVRLQYFNNG